MSFRQLSHIGLLTKFCRVFFGCTSIVGTRVGEPRPAGRFSFALCRCRPADVPFQRRRPRNPVGIVCLLLLVCLSFCCLVFFSWDVGMCRLCGVFRNHLVNKRVLLTALTWLLHIQDVGRSSHPPHEEIVWFRRCCLL